MRNLPVKRGALTPTQVLGPLATFAGYEPEKLDPLVEPLIEGAAGALSVLGETIPVLKLAAEQLRKELEEHPETNAKTLCARSETVAKIAEKAAKASGQLVDAVDKLSRLRSFLSGGPDTRVENVEHMSDQELMRVVLAAIGKCPKCGALLGEEEA